MHMPTSTDALYADHPFIERVKLTAFDERMYGARITHAFWDQLAPGWSERAEQIGISFRGRRLDMAGPFDGETVDLIRATINAGLEQGHAVAIKVDHYNRNILYQDPYGKAAPQAVKPVFVERNSTALTQQSKPPATR